MQKIIRAAATAASLSLAVLPVVGFASAAFAQERVQVADLRLDSAEGAQAFAQRIDVAANRFCLDRSTAKDIAQTQACRAAVQAEVMDKLTADQRAALRAS